MRLIYEKLYDPKPHNNTPSHFHPSPPFLPPTHPPTLICTSTIPHLVSHSKTGRCNAWWEPENGALWDMSNEISSWKSRPVAFWHLSLRGLSEYEGNMVGLYGQEWEWRYKRGASRETLINTHNSSTRGSLIKIYNICCQLFPMDRSIAVKALQQMGGRRGYWIRVWKLTVPSSPIHVYTPLTKGNDIEWEVCRQHTVCLQYINSREEDRNMLVPASHCMAIQLCTYLYGSYLRTVSNGKMQGSVKNGTTLILTMLTDLHCVMAA